MPQPEFVDEFTLQKLKIEVESIEDKVVLIEEAGLSASRLGRIALLLGSLVFLVLLIQISLTLRAAAMVVAVFTSIYFWRQFRRLKDALRCLSALEKAGDHPNFPHASTQINVDEDFVFLPSGWWLIPAFLTGLFVYLVLGIAFIL